MTRRLRPAAFAAVAACLALLAAYALTEGAVQALARLGAIREYAELRYLEAHALAPVADEGGRPESPIDPVLGWLQPSIAFGPEAAPDGATPPTILFLGDSVTYGESAVRGENDYVTRVAEAVAPRGVRVVNAASSGYGVDQMMLRVEREAPRIGPVLIVVAYIPHDLLRVGYSRFIRLTKPTVSLAGAALVVRPPEDLRAFHARQERALTHLHYGPWLLGERWAQRRALVPGLYVDWYRAVLERIASRIASDAQAVGADVVFVEIPNYADEVASTLLAPIMRARLEEAESRGRLRFVPIEACLQARAAPGAWPTPEFTEPHPGPAGHADIAACVLGEVVAPLLHAGRGASPEPGSR